MRTEVKNMEQSIAATVIAAIQTTNPINMEVEQENRSTGSSSQDTTATIKLMMDRFDALTQVVQNLATQIKEITESQDSNANKRSRSPTTAVSQTQNTTTTNSNGNRSPPAKLPRPMAPTPPSTPPPKELQKNKSGAQGGK
jgi:hypothetical protein